MNTHFTHFQHFTGSQVSLSSYTRYFKCTTAQCTVCTERNTNRNSYDNLSKMLQSSFWFDLRQHRMLRVVYNIDIYYYETCFKTSLKSQSNTEGRKPNIPESTRASLERGSRWDNVDNWVLHKLLESVPA